MLVIADIAIEELDLPENTFAREHDFRPVSPLKRR